MPTSVASLHDPISEQRARLYAARQRRLRAAMNERQVPAVLVVDPVQIRYATGARNMQVFGLRDATRCLLLFAAGPEVLSSFPFDDALEAREA